MKWFVTVIDSKKFTAVWWKIKRNQEVIALVFLNYKQQRKMEMKNNMNKKKSLLKSLNKPVFILKKAEPKLLLIEKNSKNLGLKNLNIQNKLQKYNKRKKKKKKLHQIQMNSWWLNNQTEMLVSNFINLLLNTIKDMDLWLVFLWCKYYGWDLMLLVTFGLPSGVRHIKKKKLDKKSMKMTFILRFTLLLVYSMELLPLLELYWLPILHQKWVYSSMNRWQAIFCSHLWTNSSIEFLLVVSSIGSQKI